MVNNRVNDWFVHGGGADSVNIWQSRVAMAGWLRGWRQCEWLITSLE